MIRWHRTCCFKDIDNTCLNYTCIDMHITKSDLKFWTHILKYNKSIKLWEQLLFTRSTLKCLSTWYHYTFLLTYSYHAGSELMRQPNIRCCHAIFVANCGASYLQVIVLRRTRRLLKTPASGWFLIFYK